MKINSIFPDNFINLSWATKSRKFPFINFGDELSLFIHEKLFPNIKFSHCYFDSDRTRISSIGTILHEFYNGKVLVWGTGIDGSLIHPNFDPKYFKVYAVRGKNTKHILEGLNIKVPDIFGDPGIFVSNFLEKKDNRKYKLGIIPHCSNLYIENGELYNGTTCFHQPNNENIKVISPKTSGDLISVLDQILDCEVILSESIHGCIIADALNIPNLFVSKRDNEQNTIISEKKISHVEHRYADYLSALDVEKYQIIHDQNIVFDFEKIYDLIHTWYRPVDFSEQRKNLLDNHPLNF